MDRTILSAVINNWCYCPYYSLTGLSLPGVRLVTWIILAFINWCFDIQPYQLHDQAGGVEAGGEEHDVVVQVNFESKL
jgi:hypothetical protein